MERTRTELMIEAALYGMGHELKERAYSDEEKLGAQLDDQFNPLPPRITELRKRLVDEIKSKGCANFSLEESEFIERTLTPFQKVQFYQVSPKFFSRQAEWGKFSLYYVTYLMEDVADVSLKADEIVRSGKYSEILHAARHDYMGNRSVEEGFGLKIEDNKMWPCMAIFLSEKGQKIASRIKKGADYDPAVVYRAFVDFLQETLE
jgi:hypothetical protein